MQEYAELARQAEASHLALEFSDADISSYAPAKVRKQLHFRSFYAKSDRFTKTGSGQK